jgi:hypothetical protein
VASDLPDPLGFGGYAVGDGTRIVIGRDEKTHRLTIVTGRFEGASILKGR